MTRRRCAPALLLAMGMASCASQEHHPAATGPARVPMGAAARPEEVGLDLSRSTDPATLLRAAATRNPKLRALRAQWRAAIEEIPQETALPDPMFSTGPEFDDAQGLDEWVFEVSQEIPFPTKLELKGRLADREARIAHLRYLAAVRDELVELQEALQEMAYLDRAIELVPRVRELFERYAAFAAGELQSGRTKLPETFRAEAQLAQLDYDLVRLRELRETEAERIRTIAGLPPGTPLGPAVPPAFRAVELDLEALVTLAQGHNEELRIAGVEVDRAGLEVELARQSRVPDFDVSLRHEYAARTANEDETMAMLGITLPVWEGKNRARVEEAQAREEAARAMEDDGARRLRNDVTKIYYRLTNAGRLVELYRDRLVPEATEAVAAAEELFRTGQASFAAAVETATTWYAFQLAYHRAVSDHGQAVARLEQVLGTALPRREGQP